MSGLPRLLLVGPLPPLTGAPVSFELFCEEALAAGTVDSIAIVDSSPKRLKQQTEGSGVASLITDAARALRLLFEFTRKLRRADTVIVFASNGHLITVGPPMLALAKLLGRRCYFRAFGGSLDWFLDAHLRGLRSPLRAIARTCLRHYDGVIVETQMMEAYLAPLIGKRRVSFVPGYRRRVAEEPMAQSTPTALRLIFLGIVKEDKGVFVLLESLRRLAASPDGTNITCTFYGSMYEPVRARFEAEIERTPGAQYGGSLDWRDVTESLRSYDALVLPTFYIGEGHPGVVIEAMMAGIPIVSTDFRAIPEIVIDGENGLLAQPADVESLTKTLARLASDYELRQRLARGSRHSRADFDASEVVPSLLDAAAVAG